MIRVTDPTQHGARHSYTHIDRYARPDSLNPQPAVLYGHHPLMLIVKVQGSVVESRFCRYGA